jgi:hypothetical protein
LLNVSASIIEWWKQKGRSTLIQPETQILFKTQYKKHKSSIRFNLEMLSNPRPECRMARSSGQWNMIGPGVQPYWGCLPVWTCNSRNTDLQSAPNVSPYQMIITQSFRHKNMTEQEPQQRAELSSPSTSNVQNMTH